MHAARVRFHSDRGAKVKKNFRVDVVQHAYTEGEFTMSAIVDIDESPIGEWYRRKGRIGGFRPRLQLLGAVGKHFGEYSATRKVRVA